jgi:hypothetical protein
MVEEIKHIDTFPDNMDWDAFMDDLCENTCPEVIEEFKKEIKEYGKLE